MALLDAALAFALTLAALATVATIIMEIIIRFLGLKARGQVLFVLKMFDHLSKTMEIPEFGKKSKRWKYVKTILENPFFSGKMIESTLRRSFIGSRANAVYKDISLEHFLRRVLEVPGAQDALEKNKGDLKKTLSELSAKYDEYSSAIATQFKDRTKLWSLVVGFVVAVLLNVDGLRLYQDYAKNPTVANAAIQELEKKPSSSSTAAPDASPPGSKAKPEDADVNAAAEELKKKLKWIAKLSLPIGNEYFPYCVSEAGDTTPNQVDPLCDKHKLSGISWKSIGYVFTTGDYWAWFAKVLITGMLIGLGAPFWYDVARRIGQVRTAFGGSGSGEQRHRGSDGKDEPKDRDKLLEDIVKSVT